MNWKKALLVTVLGLFALVFFVVAAAGLLATAALGTAAVAISESGVVQAFEEVADGATRLQIQVDDNAVTITNPDSGESRTVVSEEPLLNGRLDFNLPEITVTDAEGDSRVFIPGLRGVDELVVPEITITDPDNGQSRVIRPSVDVRSEFRAPRVVWDNDHEWTYYGPELGLRLVGGILRGLFNLVALALIIVGVYLLIRNRRQSQVEVDKADKAS
jgi:hypothetical protein